MPEKCVKSIARRELFVKIWLLGLQLFIVLMLVVPTRFQLERGAFLFLLAGALLPFFTETWRIDRKILFLSILALTISSIGLFVGVLNNNPGVFNVATIYFVWPVLYLFLIGFARGEDWVRRVFSAIFFGIGLCVCLATLVFLAGLFGFEDKFFPLIDFLDPGFGKYDGFTEFRIVNFTTVMYGFPFLLSCFYVNYKNYSCTKRFVFILYLLLIIFLAIVSGRRGFLLIIIMAPVVIVILSHVSGYYLSSKHFVLIAVLGIVSVPVLNVILHGVFGVDIYVSAKNFLSAFSNSEVSSGLRYTQADALWERFSESPLYGVGFGATAEVIRSVSHPWSYELFYLSLLMNVGAVGFASYCAVIFVNIFYGLKISRTDKKFAVYLIPSITALLCFLVVSGTNPYLTKFDYLWVVFLPSAIISSQKAGILNVRHCDCKLEFR
ncbi:hypothetical protein [Halomonas sp.]|uniref:hypothetical protein n=1 Tax=Halomonas sp. TaxID=1486246 RepID=UPI00257DDE2B|nr:hypothetical protein [Halomonas sp.]|tara:strand:- start:7620 stop:8930 length:1311 start_codon:yes stop_codon:yes gene_type:complete